MIGFLKRTGFQLAPVMALRDFVEYRRCLQRGTFSQHGEDNYILESLGRRGVYMDIGANHPYLLSNTYGLYKAGWDGVTVEPIKSLLNLHRRYRPRDIQVHAGIGATDGVRMLFNELSPRVLSSFDDSTAREYVEKGVATLVSSYEVQIRTVSAILDEHLKAKVDVMSIDVEGLELQVLRGIDFTRHRPRMIIVESKSAVGSSPDGPAIQCLLLAHGYKKNHEMGANDFYVT